jgi:hypothetical protein
MIRNIVFTLTLLTLSAATVYWIEAEKEIKVLSFKGNE